MLEQLLVVARDDECAPPRRDECGELLACIPVEVVARLVEQDNGGTAEAEPRYGHEHRLTAGEAADGTREHRLIETEVSERGFSAHVDIPVVAERFVVGGIDGATLDGAQGGDLGIDAEEGRDREIGIERQLLREVRHIGSSP